MSHHTTPYVAYLIIDRQVGNANINYLMNLPVVWVQVKYNLVCNFFHDFKDRMGCICQPDSNIWMDIDKLFVINLKAALINCKCFKEAMTRNIKKDLLNQ